MATSKKNPKTIAPTLASTRDELLFSVDLLSRPAEALSREFVLSNHLGSYSSSSLYGSHTRKYHGFLCAIPEGGNEKINFLSKFELSVIAGGRTHELSVNQYPGTLHPQGWHYLEKVCLDVGFASTYRIGDSVLTQQLVLDYEANIVYVCLALDEASDDLQINLRPLLAFRSIHSQNTQNAFVNTSVQCEADHYLVTPYAGLPSLRMSGSHFDASPLWLKQVEYLVEMERGFDFREDLFSPGTFSADLKCGKRIVFAFGIDALPESNEKRFDHCVKRLEKERADIEKMGNSFSLSVLKKTASTFLVDRGGKSTVIAGYPWFAEWGRDAMIALPGLTLSTGKKDWALKVLSTFAKERKNGLIPNYLALGQGENSYNSVDASLWFFWSLGQYLKATKDLKGVEKHLLPAMIDILETFSSGKAPHVSVDPTTGLLWAGSVHTQLTWMDAQVFGKPVTPRYGLAVEINALYHYGLELTIDIAKKVKATVPAHFASEKKKIEKYFEEVFVHPTHGGLCDVINEHGQDSKIRPNQVFALSLSQKLLSDKTRKKVLALVESDLLTPYGLRTLSPADPAYRSHYRGDGPARDSAYHQGTVWPWLLGAYVEAALALASEPAVKARELLVYFKPLFEDHLLQVGVGSLSEVFDAQEPYKAGGTPSQAWSVAEAIRAQELIYSHLKKTTKKSSVTLSASKVKTKTSVKTRGPS